MNGRSVLSLSGSWAAPTTTPESEMPKAFDGPVPLPVPSAEKSPRSVIVYGGGRFLTMLLAWLASWGSGTLTTSRFRGAGPAVGTETFSAIVTNPARRNATSSHDHLRLRFTAPFL